MNILGTTTEMDDSGGYATDRVSRVEFLRLSRWFTLILCLVAVILPPLFGQPGVWSALGVAELFSWKTALGGIMGLFVGTVVSVLALYWRPLHDIIQHMTGLVAWETFRPWDYFAVAVLAGLGEELLFRGALQPLIGLVPIAVIFGLLHATALAHVILATLLGLWLGWLYLWTESLWPPIAAHAALDLVTGLLLACAAQTDALLSRGD